MEKMERETRPKRTKSDISKDEEKTLKKTPSQKKSKFRFIWIQGYT